MNNVSLATVVEIRCQYEGRYAHGAQDNHYLFCDSAADAHKLLTALAEDAFTRDCEVDFYKNRLQLTWTHETLTYYVPTTTKD